MRKPKEQKSGNLTTSNNNTGSNSKTNTKTIIAAKANESNKHHSTSVPAILTRRTPVLVKFEPTLPPSSSSANTTTNTTLTMKAAASTPSKSPRSLIHVPYESAPKANISKLKQFYDQQTILFNADNMSLSTPTAASLEAQVTPPYDKRHCIPVPANKRTSTTTAAAATTKSSPAIKYTTLPGDHVMNSELQKCLEFSAEAVMATSTVLPSSPSIKTLTPTSKTPSKRTPNSGTPVSIISKPSKIPLAVS